MYKFRIPLGAGPAGSFCPAHHLDASLGPTLILPRVAMAACNVGRNSICSFGLRGWVPNKAFTFSSGSGLGGTFGPRMTIGHALCLNHGGSSWLHPAKPHHSKPPNLSQLVVVDCNNIGNEFLY